MSCYPLWSDRQPHWSDHPSIVHTNRPSLREGSHVLLDVTRTTEVTAPPADAWALVHDVRRLAGCLPNVSDLRELEPDRRYAATVSDRLGPFKLSVPVEIELKSVEEPRRIVAGLTGADSRGQARVRGDLEALVEPTEGGARLTLGM